MRQKAELLLLTGLLSRAFAFSASVMAEAILYATLLFGAAQLLQSFFNLILFVFLTAFFVAGTYFAIRSIRCIVAFFRDPQAQLLRFGEVTACDNATRLLVEKAAKKADVICPTVYMSVNIDGVKAFGLDPKHAVILVPANAAETFEPDEFECILMHEMFHIKEDLEYQSLRIADRFFVNTPINLVVTSAIFFCFFSVDAIFGVSISRLAPINFHQISIYILVLGIFSALAILYSLNEVETVVSDKFIYTRELFADAYAGIGTRKPLSLLSAIIKIARKQVLNGSSFFRALGFSGIGFEVNNPAEISPKNHFAATRMSTIFFTRLNFGEYALRMLIYRGTFAAHETYGPLKYRFVLQKKIQQLIYGRTIIDLFRSSSSFWFVTSIPKAEPEMQIPWLVMDVIQKNKLDLEHLQKYIEKVGASFNLIECSNSLDLEPFEIFLLLVALVLLKVIDF